MTNLTHMHLAPSTDAPSSPGRHRLIDLLQVSRQAQTIAATLQLADVVLGSPDPARKPSQYKELAESAIGRLDPARAKVAEYRAVQTLLAFLLEHGQGRQLTPPQRLDIVRRGFHRALTTFEMVLAGQLEPSYHIPLVDENGAVLR